MTAAYPAFLNLAGRRCVVVGGGAVAERKILGLLASDADVTVIAPDTTAAIARLESDGLLSVRRRAYEPGDLAGAFIAVAATSVAEVNRAVARDARMAGALVNVADDPAACDFTVPAVVRRGDLALAISTGGRGPGFARFLREELDAWLSDARLDLFNLIAEVRAELREAGANPSPERWRRAIRSDVLAALGAGDRPAARRTLLAELTDVTPGSSSTGTPCSGCGSARPPSGHPGSARTSTPGPSAPASSSVPFVSPEPSSAPSVSPDPSVTPSPAIPSLASPQARSRHTS